MDYFVSSIGADPATLWGWRVLFFGLVAYVLWTMYARRHALEALWLYWRDQILNLARSIWGRWGPLFQSRVFWGGAIVYVTWRLQVTLPPEALGFATDVVYALSGTLGFVLMTIGRIFASGPLVARIRRDPAAPITNVHSLNVAESRPATLEDAFNPERMALLRTEQVLFERTEARAPSAQTIGIVDVPRADVIDVGKRTGEALAGFSGLSPRPEADGPGLLLADDDFQRRAVVDVAPVISPKKRKRAAASASRAKAPTKRKTRA